MTKKKIYGFIIFLILSILFVQGEGNTGNIGTRDISKGYVGFDTGSIAETGNTVETGLIEKEFMMTYPNGGEKVSGIINITRTQFTSDGNKSNVRLFLINTNTSTISLISPIEGIVDMGSYFRNTANKEDGANYKIKVQSVDLQSIEDATNNTFIIDNTPPTIPKINFNGYTPGYITVGEINFDISDGIDILAGVYQSQYRLNSGIRVTYVSKTQITEIGKTTVEARTLDNAGNVSNILGPYTINITYSNSGGGDSGGGNPGGGVVCDPAYVSNGTVEKTTCKITCNTGYTKDKNACILSSFTPICDVSKLMCVNGTYQLNSGSSCQGGQLYQTCPSTGTDIIETGTTTITTGINEDTGNNNILKPLSLVTQNKIAQFREDNKDKLIIKSLKDSNYNKELQDAYLFAYINGITTRKTIQEAQMNTIITRAEIAKMISQYAINILGKHLYTGKTCIFQDIGDIAKDLQSNISLSCQLGIMGIQDDLVLSNFYANEVVTRAQFATIISRTLRGTQYNTDTTDYYKNHIPALKAAGIITNENPTLQELRGYVMLVLMRSS